MLKDSYNQVTGFQCPKPSVLLSLDKYLSREQSFSADCWELFSSFIWGNEVKKLIKILLKAKFRIFSFPVYHFNKDNIHSFPKGFKVCFPSVLPGS